MKYDEVLDYLEEVSHYGIVPGLESITLLCDKLGNPQNDLKFVHIAGTNGKGSILAYVSTICKKAGIKVGRYISPTIFEYRERFQVNGKMITKKTLCEGMEIVKEACDNIKAEGKPHPTPFEIETALAFWYFKQMKCDLVVLETGMGGLMDATNIIQTTEVAVLASISMDHMGFLGKTLVDIATQKAGIIKPGCKVVSCVQKLEAQRVIEETVVSKSADFRCADAREAKNIKYGLTKQSFDYREYKKLEISLAGKCQIENAIVAIQVVEALRESGYEISEKAMREGFKETEWLGRFSVIQKKPMFIVDGAHNEDAAKKLAESIEQYLPGKRIIYIMGVLKDKEYEKVISLTERYADHIITITPPANPRALPAIELAKCIAQVHPKVTAVDSVEEAIEVSHIFAQKDDVILAFGSLSFLGRIMKFYDK